MKSQFSENRRNSQIERQNKEPGSFSQSYETEITLRKPLTKSVEKCQDSQERQKNIPYEEIRSPKRDLMLLSPTALVQIGGSPYSQRYNSIRKIDFGTRSSSKNTSRKLSFVK